MIKNKARIIPKIFSFTLFNTIIPRGTPIADPAIKGSICFHSPTVFVLKATIPVETVEIPATRGMTRDIGKKKGKIAIEMVATPNPVSSVDIPAKIKAIAKIIIKKTSIWWTRGESNPRPPQCECGALPTEPRALQRTIKEISGEENSFVTE